MRFQPLEVRTPTDTPYRENPRAELAAVLDSLGARGRALDVGCGTGLLGAQLLAAGRVSSVTGVELDPAAADDARARLTEVVAGDVSDRSTLDQLPTVDLLIAADVLEHLVDPEAVLQALAGKLAPGATWLISVPNVRHWSVLHKLVVHDEWEYEEAGICDATHLRFFTRRSLLRLCAGAGLTPEVGYLLVAGRSGRLARLLPPVAGFMGVQVVLAGRVDA